MKARILTIFFLLVVLPIPAHAKFAAVSATVTTNANLRSGPGTSYAVVGQAKAGDIVLLVDESADKKWYKLSTETWIASFLVKLSPKVLGTPTPLPSPTRTPPPTRTSTPAPTNTPIPGLIAELVGYGDSVEELPPLTSMTLLVIIGNASSSYFGVTAYDKAGDRLDLLVNTTEPYSGMRAIGLGKDLASFLEVKATGPWHIYLFKATAMRTMSAGTLAGKGDEVFAVLAPHGKIANIEGNYQKSYFGVTAYGETRRHLLVNTTDAYKGTVLIGSDFMIVDVRAVGDWTFTID